MTREPGPGIFFDQAGLDRQRVQGIVEEALAGCDDGELFMEISRSELLTWDDGKLKSASYDSRSGFGLRAVAGERTGYAHSSEVSEQALRRAARTVRAVRSGHEGTMAQPPRGTNARLYPPDDPTGEMPFDDRVRLLEEADAFARALDSRVRQVTVSMSSSWQAVAILRADGFFAFDFRPLMRFNVSVITEKDGRRGTGMHGLGGRRHWQDYIGGEKWKEAVREALRQSLVSLDARPAPAGEMDVVLGPGWPGILLHEAVGHGLEGDFNRKGTSAFAGLMGERVAAPGVTVIDDGSIPYRRGSLVIDDEGTPTSPTVLIEDGRLVGYMQDRLNARLMGMQPTGNGRRESYAHAPLPRMTNTFMQAGPHDPEEIIRSVKRGLYAVSFGGGQVDITSGNFVFTCTEAYLIENGRVTAPVKDATLIGNGKDALTRVTMIGNDLSLDPGIGTCGKAGQGVPVGVGQPTLRVDGLTVGGTAA
jgi:TldD protein